MHELRGAWRKHCALTHAPRHVLPHCKTNHSWRGGILLRLVWVPALGVKPIAHLLSDTNYHSTKVIYKLRKSPGFGYDHQLGTSRNITIRTLSNSRVSITELSQQTSSLLYRPFSTIDILHETWSYPTLYHTVRITTIPPVNTTCTFECHCYRPRLPPNYEYWPWRPFSTLVSLWQRWSKFYCTEISGSSGDLRILQKSDRAGKPILADDSLCNKYGWWCYQSSGYWIILTDCRWRNRCYHQVSSFSSSVWSVN